MMLNKKWAIIIIFVLFLMLGFIVFRSLQPAINRPSGVETVLPPEPKLPAGEPLKQPSYAAQGGLLFPNSVPYYSIDSIPSKNQARALVVELGFSDPYRTVPSGNATTSYYRNDSATIVTSDTPPIVNFNRQKQPTQLISPGAVPKLQNNAEALLASLQIYETPIVLRPTNTQYFSPSQSITGDPVDPGRATLVVFNFSYFLGDYLLFINSVSAPITIGLDAAGSLVSLRIVYPPGITGDTTRKFSVAPYERAIERLRGGEGVLLRAETTVGGQELTLPAVPNASSIFKTDLGYFFTYTNPEVSLVYVFYGNSQSGRVAAKTTTVVSAAP